jgi:hypothetical protein
MSGGPPPDLGAELDAQIADKMMRENSLKLNDRIGDTLHLDTVEHHSPFGK